MGLKLIFVIVTRAVSLLGLSLRESWWKDAEILILRHQLAVAQRGQPRTRAGLTWPDRAWLALWVPSDDGTCHHLPFCTVVCIRGGLRIPHATGAYQDIRANMERTSLRTGLDHHGRGPLGHRR
jgi:hypothetical protein